MRGLQAAKKADALRGEDFAGGAEGGAATVAQKQDFGRSGERIGSVVGGHDGLHIAFAQPMLQTDEQRVAGNAVECGKRLIEEKQAGCGRERSSQGDALRLAAGEIVRAASCELGCADEVEHFIDAARAGGAIETAQAVGDVGGGVEVREERGLLRDERSLAMAGRDAKSYGGFGERAAVESDSAVVRQVETGQQAEQCAFACA